VHPVSAMKLEGLDTEEVEERGGEEAAWVWILAFTKAIFPDEWAAAAVPPSHLVCPRPRREGGT
jgi:hypothetical protein